MLTRLLKNAGALNATLVVSILAGILATFFSVKHLRYGLLRDRHWVSNNAVVTALFSSTRRWLLPFR